MKKTFFIAICAIAMLFAFTACSEDNGIDYADNNLAADLAESIYAKGAAESLVEAANGTSENGLTITYAFADGVSGVPTTGEKVSTSIVVTVDVTSAYTAGFHQDTHEFRSLTDGSGTVTVNGLISNTNGTLTFKAENYTASTTDTDDVVITDTDGDYEGKHTFKVAKIEGDAEGNITLKDGKFTTDGMTLTLPTADKVEVYLDTKPVDYNKLCSTVGVTPGEYKIKFIPGNEQ